MALFARGLEARALVDMARSIEAGVGPQHDLAVAGRTCERDAFIDEMAADGTDPYVLFAKDLFHALITPAIGELLSRWPQPLPSVVGLEPLD